MSFDPLEDLPYNKSCWKCKKIKYSTDFYSNKAKSDGKDELCKVCSKEYRKLHRKKPNMKEYYRKRARNDYYKKFHFNEEMVIEEKKKRNYVCDICHKKYEVKKLRPDHDHKLGKFRGILCNRCNTALGWYENNMYNIKKYIPYNAHTEIIKDFEIQLSKYTNAPYVTVLDSCTNAILLALKLQKKLNTKEEYVFLPKKTYVGVAQSVLNAGFKLKFKNINWSGQYKIEPFDIYDSARRFTSNMYIDNSIMCVSFHWTKPLGVTRIGALLSNNKEYDLWFKKMIFDGRTPGLPVGLDNITEIGHHMITTPGFAAEGLIRLGYLPKNNPDLPMDDYPDLSQMEIFK